MWSGSSMDPLDGHEPVLAARVVRSGDIPPQTSMWRLTLGRTCQVLRESGLPRMRSGFEVHGSCRRRLMLSMPAYATSQDILPSPGQPRFPEYATQQGLFLTLTSIGKLHFNAPVLFTVTESVLGHSCVITGRVARARCLYFLNYAVPIS